MGEKKLHYFSFIYLVNILLSMYQDPMKILLVLYIISDIIILSVLTLKTIPLLLIFLLLHRFSNWIFHSEINYIILSYILYISKKNIICFISDIIICYSFENQCASSAISFTSWIERLIFFFPLQAYANIRQMSCFFYYLHHILSNFSLRSK